MIAEIAMRIRNYFGYLKHTRTELIFLSYIIPFSSHLYLLKLGQNESLMKQPCGRNALSIYCYQLGNMTSTQCNMANLSGRCSTCTPQHTPGNFIIPKPRVTERGCNIWMLQTLLTGCLYHRLQNQYPRNESFPNSRNAGWQQTHASVSLWY